MSFWRVWMQSSSVWEQSFMFLEDRNSAFPPAAGTAAPKPGTEINKPPPPSQCTDLGQNTGCCYNSSKCCATLFVYIKTHSFVYIEKSTSAKCAWLLKHKIFRNCYYALSVAMMLVPWHPFAILPSLINAKAYLSLSLFLSSPREINEHWTSLNVFFSLSLQN